MIEMIELCDARRCAFGLTEQFHGRTRGEISKDKGNKRDSEQDEDESRKTSDEESRTDTNAPIGQYADEEQYGDNGGQAGEELIHCGASFA
jgi:hypothetical protein